MEKLLHSVPFHSQKWNLKRWEMMVFKDEDDARYWEKSSCAILCLQMAAEFFTGKPFVTSDLIRKGVSLGAYGNAIGWNHSGLYAIAKSVGLNAERGKFSATVLASRIEQGSLALVSIKWAFRPAKSFKERIFFWKKYGGHVALVVGVRSEGAEVAGFYVHHTSIREEYNWRARFIPI